MSSRIWTKTGAVCLVATSQSWSVQAAERAQRHSRGVKQPVKGRWARCCLLVCVKAYSPSHNWIENSGEGERLESDMAAPTWREAAGWQRWASLGRGLCTVSRSHGARWGGMDRKDRKEVGGKEHGLGRARQTVRLTQQTSGDTQENRLLTWGSWELPCESDVWKPGCNSRVSFCSSNFWTLQISVFHSCHTAVSSPRVHLCMCSCHVIQWGKPYLTHV